jgi:hypothetical protein
MKSKNVSAASKNDDEKLDCNAAKNVSTASKNKSLEAYKKIAQQKINLRIQNAKLLVGFILD